MFKKILPVLIVLCLAVGAGFPETASAHGYTYWTSASKVGFAHFYYNEGLDNDSGTQYSFIQRFDYHNRLLLAVFKGSVGYTPATYNGSYTDGTPLTADVDYKNWSVLGGIGIDPRFMSGLMQNQIYVSLSEDNMTWMAGDITGGYDENYNVKYLGIHYKNVYAVTPKLSTVVGVSFYKGINGTVLVSNYPLYVGVPAESVGETLGGEWKYGAKIGVRYRINNNASVTADLAYKHFFFEQSNDVYFYNGSGYTYLQEPNSNTYAEIFEIGLHIAF